jgi:glutamyl-tRNA reductase
MTPPTPTLICCGINHLTAPIHLRERVAVSPENTIPTLQSIARHLHLPEAILLSTCNRLEIIGLTYDPYHTTHAWPRYLSHRHGTDFTPHVYTHTGADTVIHLFELAAGLRSMILGETEIFGQIKQAYALATAEGFTQKITHRLFQSAFTAAKEARARTTISAGNISIGTVAADLAEKIFGTLSHHTLLLLGAGKISERTLRSLHSRGAQNILIANRTYDRAHHLSTQLPSAQPIPWETWPQHLPHTDILIASTAAQHHLLQAQDLHHNRRNKPIFIIDLSLPRNIDPAINQLENIYLYNIDDLSLIAQHNRLQRQAAIAKAQEILLPHAAKFLQWLQKNIHTSSHSSLNPIPTLHPHNSHL